MMVLAVALQHHGATRNPMVAVLDGAYAKYSRLAVFTVHRAHSSRALLVRATVVADQNSFRIITTMVNSRKNIVVTRIFSFRILIGLQLIQLWRGLVVSGFGSMEEHATRMAVRFASHHHTTFSLVNKKFVTLTGLQIVNMVWDGLSIL